MTISENETFQFGLNLFETREDLTDLFARAFAERFGAIESVQRENMHMPLTPCADPIRAMRVRFVTPTELKGAEQPDFGALFARVRDRVGALRALYGKGPLEIDFRAMGERAARVEMTRCEIQRVNAERTSRGSGQTHPLGGFTGVAEYAGELAEFVPFLEIARWTGVGRQTVWGKGEIVCEIL